jgi:hypothetical protein
MFEQLQSLFRAFDAYLKEQDYIYSAAPQAFQSWVESKARYIEDNSSKVSAAE